MTSQLFVFQLTVRTRLARATGSASKGSASAARAGAASTATNLTTKLANVCRIAPDTEILIWTPRSVSAKDSGLVEIVRKVSS